MRCPACHSWSRVLETRGSTRRRECANGHRFTTTEVCIAHEEAVQAAKLDAARRVLREKGILA